VAQRWEQWKAALIGCVIGCLVFILLLLLGIAGSSGEPDYRRDMPLLAFTVIVSTSAACGITAVRNHSLRRIDDPRRK
jgi:hypothetical protein